MKASRLGADSKVQSFRLNDKCAAGTGAFLEKTARYMGYGTEEIGPLVATSKAPVSISGVCAVFAESEVINQLSEGAAPADIMHGAIVSLVDRSVQLMKRVRMEPEFTLVGGILRFERMIRVVRERARHERATSSPAISCSTPRRSAPRCSASAACAGSPNERHRACRLTAGSGASSRIRTARREAVELYRQAGFEVRVEPGLPEGLREECGSCWLVKAGLLPGDLYASR